MLTEIRKALDNASTQHEWDSDGTFIEWKDGHPLRGTYRRIAVTECRIPSAFNNENSENDAHLIVNTPKFLEWCLSEIATLQQQNKQLIEGMEHIREYWNRDENERAMADACWKVIEITEETLQSIQGGAAWTQMKNVD